MNCLSCKECILPTRGKPKPLPCTTARKESEPKDFRNLYRLLRKNTPKAQWQSPSFRKKPVIKHHLEPYLLKNYPKLPREPRVSHFEEARNNIGGIGFLEEPMDCRQWLSEKTRDEFICKELKKTTDLSEERQRELNYNNTRRKMIARHAYLEPFLLDKEESTDD